MMTHGNDTRAAPAIANPITGNVAAKDRVQISHGSNTIAGRAKPRNPLVRKAQPNAAPAPRASQAARLVAPSSTDA